ncbi:MAG TPA: lamin tail domain-containing protein [Methanotrichaceae archaeon]|nr:lamin tail domain-containing protein [Methanotrichaceae archaeon]
MRLNLIISVALLLALAGICLGAVVIKEVELSPPGDARNKDSPQWVKLYNSGGEDVDISGWRLTTSEGKIVLPEGTVLSAYDTYKVTQKYSWLNTENESVVLMAANGSIIDRTPKLSDSARDEYAWSRIGITRANTIQDWSFQAASYD